MLESVELTSHPKTGRLISMTITVSDWLANAISNRDLLTLNPDYFRLRKPLERRIYEVVRKRSGRQAGGANIRLDDLQRLCRSGAVLREFRRMVKSIIADHEAGQSFPDYTLALDDDVVRVRPKVSFLERVSLPSERMASGLELRRHSHEDGREILQGWCPFDVEKRWRAWVAREEIAVQNPHAHYLDFCRSYVERRGPCR